MLGMAGGSFLELEGQVKIGLETLRSAHEGALAVGAPGRGA
jgi:hypothetical protein